MNLRRHTVLLLLLFLSTYAFSQEFAMGLEMDDEAYAAVPIKSKHIAFYDELADVDLVSLKQFVPTVKTQSQYGTCTGWASSYYGRTIVEANRKGITDKAEINDLAFHPIYTYFKSTSEENRINCKSGTQVNKVLESLKYDGAPYYKEFGAELCTDYIPTEIDKLAQNHRIQEYRRLVRSTETNLEKIENVKRSLFNNNPVIIGFAVEKAFQVAKSVYIPDNEEIVGYHAMCVVGFDNDRYGGAFEIVNSWGSQWGNDGYIWVKYNDFAKYAKYAYEIVPQPQPPTVTYEKLGGELTLKLREGSTMEVVNGATPYKKSVLGFQDVVKDLDEKSVGDYKTTKAYPKNTKYQILAKVNQPSYMYVLYADSDGESGVLFPNPDNPEIISPYFDTPQAELVVPGEGYFFRLNSDVSSDYTIILFSNNELDIENYATQLKELDGDLLDKLYITFGDDLIKNEEINLSDDKMTFNATFEKSKNKVAMMVLDIKRN